MPNWNDVLKEIHGIRTKAAHENANAIDSVRRKYLHNLYKHTNRNIIAYYSGFLSKPDYNQTDITDEDMNGFMMAVHKLDRSKGLDLILHTPGGSIAATQAIVGYLQQMFGNDIRAIIPQIAMSAGTIIACSCKEILMAKHSNLGPIDPHLSGVPAHGVIQEFKRAFKEVKKDPSKTPIWQSIISQYRPTFLSQCEYAIKWSNSFVREQLEKVMFVNDKNATDTAKNIVAMLSSYKINKTHSRHVDYEECRKIGLNVSLIEENKVLQDLILTVHHCFMHALMNTNSYKIIENHLGTAFVKQGIISQTQNR